MKNILRYNQQQSPSASVNQKEDDYSAKEEMKKYKERERGKINHIFLEFDNVKD